MPGLDSPARLSAVRGPRDPGAATIARVPNRLASETSPYLRQHAENPVAWMPWGDEAFAIARDADTPILLSVGYSACHWCHVMAHESFEDAETAALMNDLFVCVKVDREERPDVDALYMQATLAMTGRGGWPMTVFITPSGEPFWAGTYFPPEPRHGMPSFRDVLRGVAEAWRERRGDVTKQADTLTQRLREQNDAVVGGGMPGPELVRDVVRGLADQYDDTHGGFGGSPKFPPSLALDLLLRRAWMQPEQPRAREMAEGTLRAMADGGIFDQVGGGFHRYAVDDIWLVPHFEKMLYDNALLLRDYALAHRVTGDPAHARTAEAIATYLLREMRLPSGAFAAAQDADSPGGEGAFFVWTPDEIQALLDERSARAVMLRFGVTAGGNFEGRTILNVATPMDEVVRAVGGDAAALIEQARPVLLTARSARAAPARDDTAVASWNGLAIGALAEAGVTLARPDWIDAARVAARFVLREMVVAGRLRRAHADGRGRHLGTLDDHADMADGLLALYAADFNPEWLLAARHLADRMLDLFADPTGNGFFLTGSDAPALVARTRDLEDQPTPSGNAQAAWVLVRLHGLTGDRRYEEGAEGAVRLVGEQMARWPQAFGRAIATLDALTCTRTQVAIAGPLNGPATIALVECARLHAGPYAVIAAGDPLDPRAAEAAPLLADRPQVNGEPAAYACSGFTCRAPVTTPQDLATALTI